MTKAVREFFDEAQRRLKEMNGQEKLDTLNILSALRGPDNQYYPAKYYTGTVRNAAFPELNSNHQDPHSDEQPLFEGIDGVPWSCDIAPLCSAEEACNKLSEMLKDGSLSSHAVEYHFYEHIRYAFEAINRKTCTPALRARVLKARRVSTLVKAIGDWAEISKVVTVRRNA